VGAALVLAEQIIFVGLSWVDGSMGCGHPGVATPGETRVLGGSIAPAYSHGCGCLLVIA